LGKAACNVLVGEAVKTVAAHALVIKAFWDGIMVRDRAVPAMERGVEAGNLPQMRKTRENGTDRGEVVRLVQRRERSIALLTGEHLGIHQNRTVVIGTAVHDAVTDGHRLDLSLVAQPGSRQCAAPPGRRQRIA
jgi:hypothetical protein